MKLWEETGGIHHYRALSIIVSPGHDELDELATAMGDLPDGAYIVRIYRRLHNDSIVTNHFYGVCLDGYYTSTSIPEIIFDWTLKAYGMTLHRLPPEIKDYDDNERRIRNP